MQEPLATSINPAPLQEFLPAQELPALLPQAPVPLQALIP